MVGFFPDGEIDAGDGSFSVEVPNHRSFVLWAMDAAGETGYAAVFGEAFFSSLRDSMIRLIRSSVLSSSSSAAWGFASPGTAAATASAATGSS